MRILLVDDDAGLIQLLQLVFESRGFGVTVAFNGTQALQALERELPEVVLLDLMMPDMDGFEICRKIRANPRTADIPIIVLTAKAGEGTKQEALAAGATEYLLKPVRPSKLIKRICAAAAQPAPSIVQALT